MIFLVLWASECLRGGHSYNEQDEHSNSHCYFGTDTQCFHISRTSHGLAERRQASTA